MADIAAQFREAMAREGITLPVEIIGDGNVHRFPTNGKVRDNAGAYVLHLNGFPNGWAQNWRGGPRIPWKASGHKRTAEKSHQAREETAKSKSERAAKAAARQAHAGNEAAQLWREAAPARDDHPYLARKQIKAYGLRQLPDGRLIVPVFIGDKLTGAQTIAADGQKRFVPGTRKQGGYFLITNPDDVLCLAEGFATGAKVHEGTGHAVAIAFDAGNLSAAARALKDAWPRVREFIICADDDWRVPGNPGLTSAREAAAAIGARLAVPQFQGHRREKDTDFNDLAVADGPDAVRRCIEAAETIWHSADGAADAESADSADGWPTLEPLVSSIARKPYPIDFLPGIMSDAVREVHGFTRAPIEMAAISALAVASASVQQLADVVRSETLTGPVCLWTLVMAESGERKSALDKLFSAPIQAFELKRREELAAEIEANEPRIAAWEAEKKGLLARIEKAKKEGKATQELMLQLIDHNAEKPDPVRYPIILRGDDTTENLGYALMKEWPSAALLESEAGAIFGSHSMGPEKIMAGLSFKNKLWGGEEHRIGRRTSESFTVRGARFTFGLQVQPGVLRDFQEKNGGLARGMGFWARFLFAEPQSTQGTRFWIDPPEGTPKLARFRDRLYELLKLTPPLDKYAQLNLKQLAFSIEGKRAWIESYNRIEEKLGPEGDYATIPDVASKAAENVARVASIFHILEYGPDGEISDERVVRAAAIIEWHLNEARRFFADTGAPPEERDAAKLEDWLLRTCRNRGTNRISRRDAQRGFGGARGAGGKRLDAAMTVLSDLGRARMIETGKRKQIEIRLELLVE